MNQDYIKLLLNPVRQRIAQALLVQKEATTAQLMEILNDVPRASLYRQIKILSDAQIIEVVKEETKRGAVEKTYALRQPDTSTTSNEEANQIVQNTFMQLSASFSAYFSKKYADPQRDMVSVGSATLLMTDEEYVEFLTNYSKLVEQALQNKPQVGRKERQIAFISLPKIDN